jgi:branched-chain amino acid transport system ATP-binding protein
LTEADFICVNLRSSAVRLFPIRVHSRPFVVAFCSCPLAVKFGMLEVTDLEVAYGSITALHSINVRVEKGKIVTLIGSNGAGKSTTLRAVSGLLKVRSGKIRLQDKDITNLAPHLIVGLGVTQVPEGRMIFPNLTVFENLQMGAYRRKSNEEVKKDYEYVYSVFPRLREREKQVAGTLSGGEQQMLAIGRALMSKPSYLMLDEPSLGIAPLLVRTIFEKIVEINRRLGITILLVEQNANLALEISDYGYVLETGRVILEDKSEKLRTNALVRESYLGGA